MNRPHLIALAAIACLAISGPAIAQAPKDCANTAAPKEAATAPAPGGASSGTAPGSMGSTGWSGGTGGSYVGTHPSGPTPSSPGNQPATTGGLDPIKPSAGADAKC